MRSSAGGLITALLMSFAPAPALAAGGGSWSGLHPTKVARTEAATVRVGHYAYLLAGDAPGSDKPIGTLERYDLNTGRSRILKPLPVGLTHNGLVASHGALFSVAGDLDEGGPTGSVAAIADLYRYDLRADRWDKLAPLPDGTRGAAAVGVVGDKLLVAGGARPLPDGSGDETLSSLWIFDLGKSRTWSRGPDLPTPRTHPDGLAVGKYFYVLGGATQAGLSGKTLPTVERYDPARRRWQRMPDMPRTHWAFGVTELRGQIVVVGGAGAGGVIPGVGGLAPQVEILDPDRRHWSSLPGLRTPRHHVTAVAMGNRIYTFNGSTALTPPVGTRTVEVLDVPLPDPRTRFTEFKAPFRGASLGLSGGKITTVTTASARALGGPCAVIGVATAGGQESKGHWTIYTNHGAIFSKVEETTHLSSTGATLDGVATITGGTERYRGARGWFNIGEALSSDFKSATGTLDGVVIIRR